MPTPRDLAKVAAYSAAAGFGFAGGRSLWRWFEKNWLTASLVVAVAGGIGCAAFLLTRGGRRPQPLVIAAATGAVILVVAVGTFVSDPANPEALGVFALWQTSAAVVGAISGFAVRGKRQAVLAVERHNEDFLAAKGIRAVGGHEETWIDDTGREMVLHDTRDDAIVFRIPGKRGGRARINLDASGRMLDYVPS